MLLTVLIPVFRLDNDRKRNLEFIYNRLISHYNESEIEIVLGIQDSSIDEYYHKFDRAVLKHYNYNGKDFNKSYIFNRCIEEGTSGKYLVFLDGDVYLPFHKFREELFNKRYEVVKPFFECVFLDKETTHTFIYEKKAVADKNLKRITATGACCIILNKDILSSVRMDENFVGWGWEDIDFANQLSSKFHIEAFGHQAVHLYHEPSSANYNNKIYYNSKYKYTHKPYNKCVKKDIGVILSYFSPCNFKKPRENLLYMLDKLESAKCPTTLVEAVMPDSEPLVLPKWIKHHQIKVTNKSYLFMKENLYNIGIEKTQYSKILFLDSDILFDNPNFIDDSSRLLDNYDVIQPFESSLWLDKEMVPLLDYNFKRSFAKGVVEQQSINAIHYHPGFSWGVTRHFLNSVGGLYDHHPVGGSDLAFAFAVHPENPSKGLVQHWLNTNQLWIHTNQYTSYREKVSNFKPRVGYLEGCVCRHLYHGTQAKRNYIDRNKQYLPDLIDNDYPLVYNKDGVLEWINTEHSLRCLEYFKNRDEDE
jgi:hypothetical protein